MLSAILFLLLSQSQPVDLSPEHRLATELMTEYTTRWAAGDAAGLTALWIADGDVVTLAGGILRGQAAIRAFLEESLSNAPKSQFLTIVDAARRINDDAMLADGRWRLTSSKPSAKPVEGIFTAIFVRNAKGWRLMSLRSSIPSGGHTRGIGRTADFPKPERESSTTRAAVLK